MLLGLLVAIVAVPGLLPAAETGVVYHNLTPDGAMLTAGESGTVDLDGLSQSDYVISGELRLPTAEANASVLVGRWEDANQKVQRDLFVRILPREGAGLRALVGKREVVPDAAAAQEGWWSFRVVRFSDTVALYLGDELVETVVSRPEAAGAQLTLARGAQVRGVVAEAVALPPLQIPVILDAVANDTLLAPAGASLPTLDPGFFAQRKVQVGGVYFHLPGSGAVCDVLPAATGLSEPLRAESHYYGGTPQSRKRLRSNIEPGTYAAVHILAFSRNAGDAVPRLTVSCGDGDLALVATTEVDVAGLLDRGTDAEASLPVKLADGSTGYIHHLRVPLPQTGQMWLATQRIRHLEFSRSLRVHVNLPDPNEFVEIAAGRPSGVVVLAATLERSPVVVRHRTAEPGNIFADSQRAVFDLTVKNVSHQPVSGTVTASVSGPGTRAAAPLPRRSWQVDAAYTLAPGEERVLALDATPPEKLRGYFDCSLTVRTGEVVVQQRDTSFAMLAPDTRQAGDDSPFGVWCFFGAHNMVGMDNLRDYLGSIIHKGGWRYTYGGEPGPRKETTPEDYQILRERWKVRYTMMSPPHSYQRGEGWYDAAAFGPKYDTWKKDLATPAGFDNVYKVLHESRSSMALLRRFNETLGGEPYVMPAEEQARLQAQFDNVVKYCRAIKERDPDAKIILINDYPAVGAQYMRLGMPKELFDAFGSEGANFMREPERMPDWLSLHAILQQWQRYRVQYGYEDKPIWYTEALYHGTNPGNLSEQKQADIAVREAMLALVNGVERLAAMGLLTDSSDTYYWSNWGASGYTHRVPECNPKPSFAQFAWLTQVLDQAKPRGYVATGSTSLHVLDFLRADGVHVYPIWVTRGQQQVRLQVTGLRAVYDVYGNPLPGATKTALDLQAGESPVYVVAEGELAVLERKPQELQTDMGTVILDFDSMDALTVLREPNAVLDASWDFPRLVGDFSVESKTLDEASALRIALNPDDDPRKLLQRYVQLKLQKPITLEGRPSHLTLRVHGNGGWGRIMFECVDAKGRIWTSCGNQYSGATNSSDNKGDSYLSFDGWKVMQIPLMGRYESSDQFVAWPHNYNWWPTETPEWRQKQAAHEEALRNFPTEQAAYEQALADYEAKYAAYKAASDAGDRTAVSPKHPGRPPRQPVLRDLGIADIDYPITLTKIFVAMPPHIIYVKEEVPVADPVIYIDAIGVLHGLEAGQ